MNRWLSLRLKSFAYAVRGVGTLLREQTNAQIHLLASSLVFAAAFALDLSRVDWQMLVLTVALVWLAEALNTALEYISDAAVPQFHPLIAKAKDVAAGAVLICATFAVCMAVLVFYPYLVT